MLKRFILAPVAILAVAGVLAGGRASTAAPEPIRVLVWDEQQPAQKEAYDNFLGNAVADFLRARGNGKNGRPIEVKSVNLNEPEQGLGGDILDKTDVLIWWGQQRHAEVKMETVGKAVADRVKAGKLNLIALHSAHFATPFFAVMNERTKDDALKTLTRAEREKVQIKYVQPQRRLYAKTEPVTPSWTKNVKADGAVELEIKLPSCVFSAVRADGKPSHLTTLAKSHPIAKGVPATFDIPRTEVYDGPFYVPTPDVVLFDERWDDGAQFPGGCVWTVGKGKVFYFRPGHETYPIMKQPEVQQILENAVRWMGKK
ncbi:MAG: ThuA domain-containing protein [Actinomycetota bacterium]